MFLDSEDSFIFVLDEWDSVFYRDFMKKEDKEAYFLFLKNLLKDQPYVDLAYMTGVLPIAKYSSGSELNMFDEYNFMNDNIYDRYFGFSEEEVNKLCQKQDKICFEEIKQWYDGYLMIPNRELMEKFQRVLSRDSMGEIKEIVDRSREMLEATLACEEEKVAAILENMHDREIPFLQYGDENSLSCVITLCYLYARKDYRIEREEKSGKGYCDYFFFPRKAGKPAIILELKSGKSCEEGLEQIKKKDYLQKAKQYKKALLVAINYDKEKHHTCRIERIIL